MCACVMFACVESCWFTQWVTKTGSTTSCTDKCSSYLNRNACWSESKGTLSVHRKSPNKTRFVLPKHWCIKRALSKADGSGWKNESRTDSDRQRGGILLEPYGWASGDAPVPAAGRRANAWHCLALLQGSFHQLLRPQQLGNVWKMPHWGPLGNLPPLMLSVPYNNESKALSFTATSGSLRVWY